MKKHFVSLIIGFILITIGSTFAFFHVMNYKFVDEAPFPKEELKLIEEWDYIVEGYTITAPRNCDIEYIYDDTLGDQIQIKVYYNDEILNMSLIKNETQENAIVIEGSLSRDHFFGFSKLFYDSFVKTVKNKSVYNYSYLIHPIVEIYLSEDKKDDLIIVQNHYIDDFIYTPDSYIKWAD